MLSIGKLGAGNEHYYLHTVAGRVEDYYLGRGEAPERWVGVGAAELDLDGRVDADSLAAVLAGRDPVDGVRLVRTRSDRTPGFDLTFRAPKSVSVLFGLADHDIAFEVRAAHDVAVDAALAFLERAACGTRRGTDGVEAVNGSGFVGAAFRHRTSRAGDPHLHTHVLVANLTRTPDDWYGALDGRRLYVYAKTAGLCSLHFRRWSRWDRRLRQRPATGSRGVSLLRKGPGWSGGQRSRSCIRGNGRGASATLAVTGPAATVFDAYVAQARALGHDLMWSDKACSANATNDVRCYAFTESSTNRAVLQLRVCSTCSPPIALMTIVEGANARRGPAVNGEAPSAREPLLEVQLSETQQASARASLPTVGQAFDPFSRFRVVKGSSVQSNGNLFECLSGSVNAVVQVSGDGMQVYRRYVKQLVHETPIRHADGRIDAHRALQASGYWGAVRMVQLKGRAMIQLSQCFDD